MNDHLPATDQFAAGLGAARIHAEDLGQELSHAQGWIGAIFKAIERAERIEDAEILAEIGRYLAERSAGIVSADLQHLRAALSEVTA